MITVLLEKIIQILEGWIQSFASHAQHVEDKLDSIDSTASDIETNTAPIYDISDNTAAVITPIQNIKSNTDSIATSSQTSANNTTAILNNISTLSTNTGRAAAFAEDCATNTLDIKDKTVTIASDTTQIRANTDSIALENSKIYDGIKWLLSDKYIDSTESGASPFTFNTDVVDDLIACKVGIEATQTGTGDPSPSNIRPLTGNSELNSNINNRLIQLSFGQTVYCGILDLVTGNLIITCKKDIMSSSYLSGLTSSYIGYVSNVSYFNGPAIWVRNWNYSDMKRVIIAGGIKSLCNSFVISINNLNINSTQYRTYIRVNNMNVTSVNDFISLVQTMETNGNNLEIIYELDSPVILQLTAQQITTIKGDNTISTDTNGNIEVTFKESIKNYLDKQDN